MASIIYVLIDTVVARLLDPVVLVTAVVVTLALCSGLAARMVETLENVRWPLRGEPMTTDETSLTRAARG